MVQTEDNSGWPIFLITGVITEEGGLVYIPAESEEIEPYASFEASFFVDSAEVFLEETNRVFDDQFGSAPIFGAVTPIRPQITLTIPLEKINTSSQKYNDASVYIKILPSDRVLEETTEGLRYRYVVHVEFDDGTRFVINTQLDSKEYGFARFPYGLFSEEPFITANSESVKIIIQPVRIDRNENSSSSSISP